MAADPFLSASAGKFVDCVYNAGSRQLGYLLHYEYNMRKLRKQTQDLENKKERVQPKIDEARTKGDIIEADVQQWIQDVESITYDVKRFFDDENKANKKCLKGWCINFSSCYRFSKEALRKIEEISLLLAKVGEFETVSHPDPTPRTLSLAKGSSDAYESRRSLKKQVMEALNDENVSVIGICGMGGVGKTTLVKEITAENVVAVWADVTRTPSIIKIQEDVANMLRLPLHDSNESARAYLLWERIKKEKQIYLILDDVWERIELQKVGLIPHPGCKIVLISRRKDVCKQMDAQKIFTVETLSEEESWDMFRKLAGEVVENGEIKRIAREVAAYCGGLPITIETVARALKNNNDRYVWNDAARQLKMSIPTEIMGMPEKVFATLEPSYNDVESELAKSVFLLCCLFPRDFNIPIELLVRYGMGLGLFKHVYTVEEARGRAHTLVSVLDSFFLLSIVDDDTEKFVKMNDIIRDFAFYKSMNNHMFMAQTGIELREWPSKDMFKDFERVSLMSNDLHDAPDGLEGPKLQALLLQNNPEMIVPESFFEGMKDLKVLDLSYVDFMSLPTSISLLTNVRTLCLNNCNFVNHSVDRIGKLTKLEILSLSSSNVKEIPVEFSQLTSLRLFDLTNCKLLRRIPQNVISCLGKLEELYMKNSFIEWNFSSNARVIESQASPNDISLDFTLPTQFRFFDLSDHTKLKELPQGIISGLKKLELYMAICSKKLDFEQGGDSSSNAKAIESQASPKDISLGFTLPTQFGFFDLSDRTKLRELPQDIVSGFKKQELYMTIRSKKLDFEQGGDSSSNARVTELQTLSKLTSLHIHMKALPTDMPFQKLTNFAIGIGKSMAYNSCPSSRTLSLSDSRTPQVDWFKNLLKKTENLYLCRIQELEVVFPDFDDVGINKLKSLTLAECEEVMYLLNTSEQTPDDVVFPNLEQLSLSGNPKLEAICKGKLPDKSWSKVKAIDVKACHSMSSIVTSHLLQRLQSLERFQAVNCEKVVYAFDFEGPLIVKEETSKFLPMLQILELTMLTKMEQVWKGDSQLMSLCNLKRLKLDFCLELKKLFSPALQQTLLSLEHLEVICCYKLEEIFEKKETADIQEAQAIASQSLGKLRFILTKSCTQLKTLFTPSIIESLVQLRTLKVQSCTTMKEVIADEEGEGAATKKRIVFPNLYEIHLEKLDSLICFCPGMYTTPEFPALEILRIDECPKMKMFGYGDQITPKLKKVIQGTKEHWFGSLNLTVQQLFKEEQQEHVRGSFFASKP